MLKKFLPEYHNYTDREVNNALKELKELQNPNEKNSLIGDFTTKKKTNILPFDEIETQLLPKITKSRVQQDVALMFLFEKSQDSKELDLSLLMAEFWPRKTEAAEQNKKNIKINSIEAGVKRNFDEEVNLEESNVRHDGSETNQTLKNKAAHGSNKEEERVKQKKERDLLEESKRQEDSKKKAEEERLEKQRQEQESRLKKEKEEEQARLKQEEEERNIKKLEDEKKLRKLQEEQKEKERREEAEKKEREAAELKKRQEQEERERIEAEQLQVKKQKEKEEQERQLKEAEDQRKKKEAEEKQRKEREQEEMRLKKEKEETERLAKIAQEEADKKAREEKIQKEKEAQEALLKAQKEEEELLERERVAQEALLALEREREIERRHRAAVTIQKRQRGIRDRKRVKELRKQRELAKKNKSEKNLDDFVDDFGDEFAAGYNKQDQNHQRTTDKHNEIDIPMDADTEKAATKIQATYKGKKEREKIAELKKQKEERSKVSNINVDPFEGEDEPMDLKEEFKPEIKNEEIDIPMDAETEKAATKIQASYKGKKDREMVNEMKKNQHKEKKPDEKKKQVGYKPIKGTKPNIAGKIGGVLLKVTDTSSVASLHTKALSKEEIDIPLDADTEKAATKIQATFKGKKDREKVNELRMKRKEEKRKEKEEKAAAKKEILESEEIGIPMDADTEIAATKIQATFKGKKARQKALELKKAKEERRNAEKEALLAERNRIAQEKGVDINMGEDTEKAATKIQAVYKGKKDRQKIKDLKNQKPKENSNLPNDLPDKIVENPESEDIDIPLNADTEKAAVKIQSTFKGKKERKRINELKQKKREEELVRKQQQNQAMEEEKAAIKIQAAFKGKKARKRIKQMKKDKVVINNPLPNDFKFKSIRKEELETLKLEAQNPTAGQKSSSNLRMSEGVNDQSGGLEEEGNAVETIPGTFRVQLMEILINEEIELEENYSMVVLCKSGEHSKNY
jgi:hypothetical protein